MQSMIKISLNTVPTRLTQINIIFQNYELFNFVAQITLITNDTFCDVYYVKISILLHSKLSVKI